jgi:hypothetical protein
MKNAHLRRTSMYASLLGISGALHLEVFDQPAERASQLIGAAFDPAAEDRFLGKATQPNTKQRKNDDQE